MTKGDAQQSSPLAFLPGGGKNVKYVKNCTELYLGGLRLDRLSGFGPFVNLEALWINNNKLKYVKNLDRNFRIRVLYAQDNQICTLKGSLRHFKFLEVLDLSNNQLRDLSKLANYLKRFNFLTHLNLSGNPCCEEPDYRLMLIHELPSVRVLDNHVVSDKERTEAATVIGGEVAALTIAFSKKVPPYNPEWDEKVPTASALEQEVIQEAATILLNRQELEKIRTAESTHVPHPDGPQTSRLPPAPAWKSLRLPQPNVSQSAPPTARGITQTNPYKFRDTFKCWNCRLDDSVRPLNFEFDSSGVQQGSMKLEVEPYRAFLETKRMSGKWAVSRTTVRL